MLASYYILHGMYESDETSSSITNFDNNQSLPSTATDENNQQAVAIPSTSYQSPIISYFFSQSTSDTDVSDVIPTESEITTSVSSVSEESSSTNGSSTESSNGGCTESLPTGN